MASDFGVICLLRRRIAENKFVSERAVVKLVSAEKKESPDADNKILWKSRILIFQSLPWKSKAERSKASSCCLQV